MTEANGAALAELSASAGILDWYWDHGGRQRFTSDDTRRSILTALGFDVQSPDAVRASLDALRAEETHRLITPVEVVELGSADAGRLVVRAPAARVDGGTWRLEVVTEEGARHVSEGSWRGDGTFPLPGALPFGYHRITLAMHAGVEEWNDAQTRIVVPPRCIVPSDVLGDRPAFGTIANLYTVRSRTDWGVGDFSDLAKLADWTGAIGGDFVGVNPLHALLNRGKDISPYGPVSRLFRNPIYVDVARVPELAMAEEVRTRLASPEFIAELDALRETPFVRYEQVMAVKGIALDALHRVFVEHVRGSRDPRAADYRAYVTAHEPALTRFATWMTIAEHQHSADWRTWPADLRRPDSDAVERFAATNAQRVDFHRWVQFEADRQLSAAADRARDAGMRIGLYQDLAIGSSPSGADTWSNAGLFVRGVDVGAPPDPYSATGQNWGLPPLDPRTLRRDGYRYFIDLIRAAFRHAGALRIDHVMGLFRLFWIPEGVSGEHGAYVRYPAEDLLGIIALESVRNNALVVGEDLGTVPEEVPPRLAKWGILSSKVLYFERDWHGNGGFKPSSTYPSLALATANTHDMPTIAGFWTERDIAVRRDVGLITSDEDEARARAERDRERASLVHLLAEENLLPSDTVRSSAELRGAIHGFLWNTPAELVGFSLDDVAGETEAVNVPGVGPDRYPSWTRKMRADLDVITSSDEADLVLARVRSA